MIFKETKDTSDEQAEDNVPEMDDESIDGKSPKMKAPSNLPSEYLKPFVRAEAVPGRFTESEKVKLLALLKGVRDEMNQPMKKGMKEREYADMFIERYNFFLIRVAKLFPNSDFLDVFTKLQSGSATLEKIRLELTLMIAYIQNDIMDIIEASERLKEKNKWLQDRIREFEIKIAGIQAIK